jgi:propionyl-CoA carboxylase alpha chain
MFVSVKNEAKKSFSDDTIFVEKYIENPRHIEIQVIADKHGNVVCLGERECSIQRNHQKIIEEAPSSFITPEVRAEMYKQSTLLAKKVGYDSAGTVEYIVDKNKNFYFLEMNTRLQVEHPVTEFVTGYDLVELMLKIADGQKLPFTQSDVKLNGHSFEARICSEDPSKNFLPSTGWLYDYKEPEKSDVVRVDTGIKEGCFITQYYDPMIAKLIVYGKTREEARKTLLSSLGEFYISGVETNITFLENIIMNQDFINGNISTNFIKQKYQNNYNPKQINEEFTPYFAIASLFVFCSLNSNANDRKQYVSIVQGKNVKITLMSFTTTEMKVTLNDISYSIKTTDNMPFSPIKKILKLKINDTEYKFRTKVDGIFISLSGLGLSASTTVIDGNFSILLDHIQNNLGNSGENYSELEVPIAGVVTQVYVKEGQIVDSGSPLMTIEAMKMENFIFADFKTKIKKINYKIGDVVSVGNIAIEFDNADSLCVSESASEHTSSNDPSLIKESNSSVGASGNSDSYVKSGLKN